MKFHSFFLPATFVHRENRFLARVRVDGECKETYVHVPSPGRMKELLIQGTTVILRSIESNSSRKTNYDLFGVKTNSGQLVIIDSQLANQVVKEAIEKNEVLPQSKVFSEQKYGSSRFDFLVVKPNGKKVFIEVKSVTLNIEGIALFPDAPTIRGTRHVNELVDASQNGYETMVIFLVMREDCSKLSPNKETDPNFAVALQRAKKAGVKMKAYSVSISQDSIEISKEIPVVF